MSDLPQSGYSGTRSESSSFSQLSKELEWPHLTPDALPDNDIQNVNSASQSSPIEDGTGNDVASDQAEPLLSSPLSLYSSLGSTLASEGLDDYVWGRARLPGACANCKMLKVRCDFPPDAEACKKCRSSGKECIIPTRKPRKPPAKREELIRQIREKNIIISQLVEHLEGRSQDSHALTSSSITANNPPSLNQSQLPSETDLESLKQAEEKRENDIRKWILKAKSSVDSSAKMGFGMAPSIKQVEEESDEEMKEWVPKAEGGDDEKTRMNFGLVPGTVNWNEADGGRGQGITHGLEWDLDGESDGGFVFGDSGFTFWGEVMPFENEITGLQRRFSSGKGEHKVIGVDCDSDIAARAEGNEEGENVGVGNSNFFKNIIKPHLDVNDEMDCLPTILEKLLASPKEVEELFTTDSKYVPPGMCAPTPPYLLPSGSTVPPPTAVVQYVLAANGALAHLAKFESTIQDILARHGIAKDTPILAGFDETLVQRGVGLLETIYVILFEEAPAPNALCESLGPLLCPYPGIVLTPTQSHRTKICGPGSSDEENHVAILTRTIQYTNTHSFGPPSECILDSKMVSFQDEHYDEPKIPGGWDGGDTGRNGDEKGSSTGEGKEKELSDPNGNPPNGERRQGHPRSDSGNSRNEQSLPGASIKSRRSLSEESENPDPNPIPGRSTLPPFAHFNCKALVFLGQNSSSAENKAALRLRIIGQLECHSQESPRVGGLSPPTLYVNFKELAFEGISNDKDTTYRQILARVSMNVHDYDIKINSKPISTRAYDDTSKESFAVTKGSTTTGSGGVGWKAVPVFLASLAHTRANETSLAKEQVRCESRVIMYRMDEYVYWVLHVDDPNQQQTGLNLADSPSRLPKAEFEFYRAEAVVPTHVDVEVESFWSLLTGLESTKDLQKLQKRKLLNVSHCVQLKVPSNLSEASNQKPTAAAKVDCKGSSDITPETSNQGVYLRCGVDNVTKPRLEDVRQGRSGLRDA